MISSASRALRILQIVGRTEAPIGVAEVARMLDIVPGTAFRSLHALEGLGFLERYRSSSKYVLGPVAKQLHQHLLSRFKIRNYCQPYLDQLSYVTGETASLFVPVGWYSLRISAAPGTNDVTSYSPIGEVRKLEQSLAGRLFLAHFGDDRLAEYMAWSATRPPAVAAKALTDRLAPIRAARYASEPTGYAPGRRSVALPIRKDGAAIAAIAIEGPVLEADQAGNDVLAAEWQAALSPLEAAVQDGPADLAGPFAHLSPADIDLEFRADAD